MSDQNASVSRYIAVRYISSGKRSHLVSFMSAISILGLTLGVAILITVLSVMNGFDKEMRNNILRRKSELEFMARDLRKSNAGARDRGSCAGDSKGRNCPNQ